MPRKPKLDKYESRECATLGTNFRDVYKNGKLFAIQVDKNAAAWFCKHPWAFTGSVSASIEKLRCWMMEQEYLRSVDFIRSVGDMDIPGKF
jgi:hypothetical protein